MLTLFPPYGMGLGFGDSGYPRGTGRAPLETARRACPPTKELPWTGSGRAIPSRGDMLSGRALVRAEHPPDPLFTA